MSELTKEQKTKIRAWIKEWKNASYVWINKEGAVNYTTDQGSFFAGWGEEFVKEININNN